MPKKNPEVVSVLGHDLLKELEGRPVLGANALDFLLAHPYLIPEKWKKRNGAWEFCLLPTALRRQDHVINGAADTNTLAEMIAAAGFLPDRLDADINEEHFPLGKEGPYDPSGLRLFGGDRGYSIDGVAADVEPNGGSLEGLVRGLAYIKANPAVLKDGPIIFPGSSWVCPDGRTSFPVALLVGGEPWLHLYWVARGDCCGGMFRFLVSGEPVA